MKEKREKRKKEKKTKERKGQKEEWEGELHGFGPGSIFRASEA